MANIMQHFLSKGWFPHDFIFVDDAALSRLPVDSKRLPTFLYATNLSIWHEAAERQTIALYHLGYTVGRLIMDCEEAYSWWMGAFAKGIGLGHWVGKREDYKFYYWSCWMDQEGKVDGEVNPFFGYDEGCTRAVRQERARIWDALSSVTNCFHLEIFRIHHNLHIVSLRI